MTCLNGNILWCFTTLLLTFTHGLPRYHTLIPIFSSKKPQDINLPYVSSPSFKKKKKNSLPPVSGRTLLLNHLMVKQWSAIFSSPPARRLWSLPSHRSVCAFKASESARCFCLWHQFVKHLFCVGVSRRNVSPWMIFLFRGTGLYECAYMRMDADCRNKATIVLKGSMGNLRAFREDVFMCV